MGGFGCVGGGGGSLDALWGPYRAGLPGCLLGSSILQPPWEALPVRTSPGTWAAPADLSKGVWDIEPGVGRRQEVRGKYVVSTMATKCVK